MMTLPQYIAAENITQAEFAARIGSTQGTVSKLCAGRRRPHWDLAITIERETGGKVPVSVWASVAREGDAA